MLCGLAYIHRQRVLHRDLSPSNVFISVGVQHLKTCSHDTKLRAVIGDFGASCLLQSKCDASAIGDVVQRGSDDTFTTGSANLFRTSGEDGPVDEDNLLGEGEDELQGEGEDKLQGEGEEDPDDESE